MARDVPRFRPGDMLSAADLNAITAKVVRHITMKGGQVLRSGGSIVLVPKVTATAAASASVASGIYAKIVGHAGTEPPFVYTAYLCTHDGSSSYGPENFVNGTLISAALVNLAEVGPDGTGVGPLEPDTIVKVASMGNGKYACESWANCGTY